MFDFQFEANMWAIILFAVSLVGLLIFFFFKYREIEHGSEALSRVRSHADTLVSEGEVFVKHKAPVIGARVSQRAFDHARPHIKNAGNTLIQLLGKRLLNIIAMVKGKGIVQRDKQASPFLQDVARDKKERSENNNSDLPA